MATRNRSQYFKNYNQKSPVKSIRFPPGLFHRVNEVVIHQKSTFSKVVIQIIDENIGVLQSKNGCNTTTLQQLYDFFLRNKKHIKKFTEKDIEMIQSVEAILNAR